MPLWALKKLDPSPPFSLLLVGTTWKTLTQTDGNLNANGGWMEYLPPLAPFFAYDRSRGVPSTYFQSFLWREPKLGELRTPPVTHDYNEAKHSPSFGFPLHQPKLNAQGLPKQRTLQSPLPPRTPNRAFKKIKKKKRSNLELSYSISS